MEEGTGRASCSAEAEADEERAIGEVGEAESGDAESDCDAEYGLPNNKSEDFGRKQGEADRGEEEDRGEEGEGDECNDAEACSTKMEASRESCDSNCWLILC